MEYKGTYIKNENIITWENRFAIGIPVIDADHKKLVELCNNLYKTILAASEEDSLQRREAVKTALKECVSYVQIHFANEEKLMKLCNYKDFDNHKNCHTSFAKQVLEKVQNFDKETYSSSLDFVKFLYDWVLSHIAYTDTLYVKDLKEYLSANKG